MDCTRNGQSEDAEVKKESLYWHCRAGLGIKALVDVFYLVHHPEVVSLLSNTCGVLIPSCPCKTMQVAWVVAQIAAEAERYCCATSVRVVRDSQTRRLGVPAEDDN